MRGMDGSRRGGVLHRRRAKAATAALAPAAAAVVLLTACVPERDGRLPVVPEPVAGTLAPTVEATLPAGTVEPPAPPDWGCPVQVPDPHWQRAIHAAAKATAPGRERRQACELAAIARAESAWNPRARSPVGAEGLFQLMPATAAHVGIADRTDPVQAIRGGAKYWQWQRSQWKAYERTPREKRPLALAGWNWGLGHVLRVQRREGCRYGACFYPFLPRETQDFTWRVEHLYWTGEWQAEPPDGWRPPR